MTGSIKPRLVKLMPEPKTGRPKTHNLSKAQYANEWRKKQKRKRVNG